MRLDHNFCVSTQLKCSNNDHLSTSLSSTLSSHHDIEPAPMPALPPQLKLRPRKSMSALCH
jgi:hypothetical protein